MITLARSRTDQMESSWDAGFCRGVARDYAQGIALYGKAADRGYAGDERSAPAQAVAWYQHAVDQDHASTQTARHRRTRNSTPLIHLSEQFEVSIGRRIPASGLPLRYRQP